jgi:hypothetical protein
MKWQWKTQLPGSVGTQVMRMVSAGRRTSVTTMRRSSGV